MSEYYEYSEYNEFNRVPNLDGIEGKIIQHLLHSKSKAAETFWKLLKYDDKYALSQDNVTLADKVAMVDGNSANTQGGQTGNTRLFVSPFVYDASETESTYVHIYVDDIHPIDHMRSNVSVTVETVVHALSNAIIGDADLESNPNTNPNDYYYADPNNPAVQIKSRATVLLKCIIGELNGLFLDGIGYLQFNTNFAFEGEKQKGYATLSLFNDRAYFGHKIQFNMAISGISSNPADSF